MIDATVLYCLRDDSVLLGLKKRGFGQGKINGYGGKLASGETPEDAAVRELHEESGLHAQRDDLEKVALIEFSFLDRPEWDMRVHAYILRRWQGEPYETEEMTPSWHRIDALPLDEMWIDDVYWLGDALAGKSMRATFVFTEKGSRITDHAIQYLPPGELL